MNLVGLSRWGLVPVRMLTVGADAVAKLHTQGAVSERSRVGAAERARPLGVGVDVFGELEAPVVRLQPGTDKLFIQVPRKPVRDYVPGRGRASIREMRYQLPNTLSRDSRLHSVSPLAPRPF
jgi:hypothetical protein